MHALLIILGVIGIHGALAMTIAQDGLIAYKVGSAAVQVYEGYEKQKTASLQRNVQLRWSAQRLAVAGKVHHLSHPATRVAVHPMPRLPHAQTHSGRTKVVANP